MPEFEDVIATVCYFMRKNPRLCFVTAYEDRSAHFQLEYLAMKWDLLVQEEVSFKEWYQAQGYAQTNMSNVRVFVFAKRELTDEH